VGLATRVTLTRAVTRITLTLYPLRPAYLAATQLALFSAPSDARGRALQETLRRLRQRFGELIVIVASLLGPPRPARDPDHARRRRPTADAGVGSTLSPRRPRLRTLARASPLVDAAGAARLLPRRTARSSGQDRVPRPGERHLVSRTAVALVMCAQTRSQYIELHAHSSHSLLDGVVSPQALVAHAASLEMPALALTDHDGLYGAVPFIRAAEAAGIKPLLGRGDYTGRR
jgi:hypothetical protein